MKITNHKKLQLRNANFRRSQCGMMLIDCIVYVGLFFVILGIAFCLFYSCWDNAKRFRRTTDEIVATLKAGERWRADVRTATAVLQVEASPDGTVLRIPHKSSEIDYRFFENALWRRTGPEGEWTQVLLKLKSSRMEADQRRQVSAWRWEVELATQRNGSRIAPLFTFEAVPQPTN